jgi:hypothetical protein
MLLDMRIIEAWKEQSAAMGFPKYDAANMLVRARRPKEVQRLRGHTQCHVMKILYVYISGTDNVDCTVVFVELSCAVLKYIIRAQANRMGQELWTTKNIL